MPYLSIFRLKFEKRETTVTFEATWNFPKCKVSCKIENPRIWDQNCLWSAIFQNYCHIWNQQSQICQYAKLHAKLKKKKNLEPPYLGIFRQDFEENYCHVWCKHSGICKIEKILVKPNLNMGPQILLFWIHLG